MVGFRRNRRHLVEAQMPSTRTQQPTAEQERASLLLTLGFDATQAFLLAATRNGGAHVETTEVQRMLENGCTHATALRILL
jgi:hypothetical protein